MHKPQPCPAAKDNPLRIQLQKLVEMVLIQLIKASAAPSAAFA